MKIDGKKKAILTSNTFLKNFSGLINLVMAYIFVTCLNHAAECQVHKIRGLFFKSVLRQDIGWYDTHQTGDFASKMAE